MATFFVADTNKVGFRNAAVPATAEFRGGVLYTAVIANAMATATGGSMWQNGIIRLSNGRLRLFDATAGLPANVAWCNGLPLDTAAGGICYSTNAMAFYSNGLPFDAAGALCAIVT